MAVRERTSPSARPWLDTLALRAPFRILLAIVIAIGLGLRLWGIDYGLPYAYHPDEPFLIGAAWRMYRSGDMNPHFWDYPTMQMYALVAFIAAREALQGWLPFLAAPGTEYLLGRLLNVAYAVGTVFLVYRAGRDLLGKWEGLIAAALLATAQQHNLMSHFLKVDVPATFFSAATLAASVHLWRAPTARRYALAGAMVGLTAAGKYPAASVAIVVVVAHLFAWRRLDLALRQSWRLVLAGACAPVAFVVACPYTVLDAAGFVAAFRGDVVAWAATGHDGWDGDVAVTYLRWIFASPDGPMGWLALVGAGLALVSGRPTDRWKLLLLAAFPLVFFVELGQWMVRFPWYLLPMAPYLAILGGWGAVEAARRLAAVDWRARAAWSAIVLVGLTAQGAASADVSSLLAAEDVRTTALHWIDANVPAGSRVAREGYTPEVDPARYQVAEVWRAIDRTPDWYRAERIDYLVLGNLMYGRYFKEPEKYATQIEQYRALTGTAMLVRSFDGPALGSRGGVVDVYRLSSPTRS